MTLHLESNKGKGEFMEMLYIKREGRYSINLKTDLFKYKWLLWQHDGLYLKTMF